MCFCIISSFTTLIVTESCTGDDTKAKDLEKPEIVDGEVPSPIDCEVYHIGEEIPFRYTFTDNGELGNFNWRSTTTSTTTLTPLPQATVLSTPRRIPSTLGCTIRISPSRTGRNRTTPRWTYPSRKASTRATIILWYG